VLASLFDPIHRLLAHPQLALILLWIGLAFLIVALIIMIRTNWGQSHPLRKCAALSLLAHLLLLCYATSIHIVTASGSGHQGGMSLLLMDGSAEGSDAGSDDGSDQSSFAIAEPGEQASTDTNTINSTVATHAIPHVAPPPLLEVAAQPPPKTPEPDKSPAKIAEQPTPIAESPRPEAATPKVAPAVTAAEDSKPPDVTPEKQTEKAADQLANKPPETPPDKPAEPLSSEAAPAPLAKLPDPPVTTDASDWVSGDPSGAATPAQPTAANPTKADASVVKDPTATADQLNSVVVRTPPATNPASSNSAAPNSAPTNSNPTGPIVENSSAAIAGHPVPQIYSDRVSPNRQEVARQRGGSPGSESAVQGALHWLALHQSSDGRWDANKFGAGQESAVLGQDRQGAGARADTAVTGLALLAFLGAGNTHEHGDYAANVQRALEFLINSQGRDGNLAGEAETFAFMYSHGMATLAMSEAYAMTGDKRLQPAVQAAINYTLSAQIRATGGWRYRAIETPGERGDTSQLGWQLMSLKSAELAGINVPPSATDGAVRFIKSVSAGQFGGKASYRPGERPSRPMTAEALVCRQFLGMARDNPAGDEAGEYISADLPRTDRINLYYWYYATLGMYQLQGEPWQRWNEALQTTLVNRQRTDGDLAGSWDPECIWGGYGGRVYSTALSTLCLEVYYRYLPLYQIAGRAQPTAAGQH
jgi:hypothetical protein